MPEKEKRFLHIGFTWAGDAKIEELFPAFNTALDWIRYAPNCWIVWTNSSPDTWFARLKPHIADNSSVMILELNISQYPMNFTGWQQPWIWEWVQKNRNNLGET